MTCPWHLHSDRSQLMALASYDAVTVTDPAFSSITGGQAVASIHQPLSSDISRQAAEARAFMIAARCKRQTFRSNEVRKRYLAVHTALARLTCSEGE